jgi:hypothetical protein
MANVQTQNILNRVLPLTISNPAPLSGGGGVPDAVVVIVQATSAGTTNDTVEFCRIETTARILSIERMNLSLGGPAPMDLGLAVPGISPAFTGGGLQTALCTGAAMGTASAIWAHAMGTGSTPTVVNMGKMAWELAGAASDPALLTTGNFAEYVIVGKLTGTTAPTSGAVALRITYQTR